MWNFFDQHPYLIAGLTGAIFTFLVTKFVLRPQKKLIYRIKSKEIVRDDGFDSSIQVDDEPVRFVYRHEITIRHVGNTTINEIPIQILCNGGKFLGPIEVDGPQPSTKKFQDQQKLVTVKYKFLNSGEKLIIKIRSIESQDIVVLARAQDTICKEHFYTRINKIFKKALGRKILRTFVELSMLSAILYVLHRYVESMQNSSLVKWGMAVLILLIFFYFWRKIGDTWFKDGGA